MASFDESELLGTFELRRFPEHVENRFAVYKQRESDEDETFTGGHTLVGDGETEREAWLDAFDGSEA